MTALAAVCAGVAVALLLPGVGAPRRWHRGRAGLLATAVAAGTLVVVVDGTALALGLVCLLSAAAGARVLARGRERRAAVLREAKVLEVCEVLVGELRSGRPPVTALEHCVAVWPDLDPVATAARFDADVPEALRRLAAQPGAAGLRAVASAWTVAQGTGAGLATILGQVASSARDAQATRRLVAAELSSAQATARLVAALPVVTLVMGSGIGGDPWWFLLRTTPGLVCLAVGVGLAFLGLAWIDRIAGQVMRR